MKADPHRRSWLSVCALSLILASFPVSSRSAASDAQASPPSRLVRVGIYQNPPKIFLDEDGRPAGIFVDLLTEVSRKENWRIEYVPGEWAECLEALSAGRIDLMPDVAYSRERDQRFDFHAVTALESWSQLYASPRFEMTSLTDLQGRRVVLLDEAIQTEVFRRMMEGFGYRVTYVPAKSYPEAFDLVRRGRADVVVTNQFFGDYSFRRYGLAKTPIVFLPSTLYFATAEGRNASLLAVVDRHLKSWIADPLSPYYKTLSRWMDKPPARVLPRWLGWLLVVAVAALGLALGVILLLRSQVRLRTRHLEEANLRLLRSEKALRDKFREIEQVFDTLPVALVFMDLELRILRVNPEFVRIFGYAPEEVAGKDAGFLYVNPADFREMGRKFSRKQDAREIYEADNRRKNGEVFRGAGVGTLLVDGANQKAVGILTLIRDVTEQRRLEARLVQSQKMESVARLAGGVAHDYNNMLSIILNYTQMALNKIGPAHPLNADLQEVMAAAKHSADITRQLLAFAREQAIAPREIDLNHTVESMLKMVRRLVGEGIALDWEPARDLGSVRMDVVQVGQILANLCVNARDAIRDVGRIVISTREAVLDEAWCETHAGHEPGKWVVLSVKDDGSGMTPETLERLFEPFFTTKAQGMGTGLGLATVHGIVRQNRGFIDVASEPGKGSVFDVYLPRSSEAAVSALNDAVEGVPSGRGERVLLVEDEPGVLKVTCSMLEGLGYRVWAAGSPQEALELAAKHAGEIRMLLTDVVMPGMNGRELATRVQDLVPGVKVLFASGYPADVLADRGIPGGEVNFIAKPFSIQELAVKAREILDGN